MLDDMVLKAEVTEEEEEEEFLIIFIMLSKQMSVPVVNFSEKYENGRFSNASSLERYVD